MCVFCVRHTCPGDLLQKERKCSFLYIKPSYAKHAEPAKPTSQRLTLFDSNRKLTLRPPRQTEADFGSSQCR